MARLGKGKDNITVRVTRRMKGYIAVRGAQENLTSSRMGLKIIEWWVKNGAPCVTDAGRKLTPIPYDPDTEWESVLGLQMEEIVATAPGGTPARFRR